jgi:hypothetical protein
MSLVPVPDILCDGFEGLAARHPAITRPLIERRDMIAVEGHDCPVICWALTHTRDWRLFLIHLWAGIDAGTAHHPCVL